MSDFIFCPSLEVAVTDLVQWNFLCTLYNWYACIHFNVGGGGYVWFIPSPKIHVPKYQIRLSRNQKWKERVVNGGLGTEPLMGVFRCWYPKNGGFSCLPIEDYIEMPCTIVSSIIISEKKSITSLKYYFRYNFFGEIIYLMYFSIIIISLWRVQ